MAPALEVEEVLRKIGFGWPQMKLFLLIQTIHYNVMSHIVAFSFIGVEPPWTCGELEKADVDPTDKCQAYSDGVCKPQYTGNITTIVTEWNLICDKSSLAKLSQSMFFIGAMLGAWLWGTVADRIGRRKVYFLTIILSAATGLGYSFAPTYSSFVLFRLLVAVSVAGTILSSYVLSIELTGSEGRTEIVMLSGALYTLCLPLLALQAYLFPNWRWFGCVTSLTGLLVLLLWRVVPKSPRWLLVQGQEEEARTILTKISLDNGVDIPLGQLKIPTTTTSLGEPVSVLDLFRGRVIRRRTLVLFVTWFSNCMLYYALTMSAGELGGNRYVSLSLAGLVEIPSFLAGYFLLDKWGRKKMHGSFLTGGGIACLGVALLQWIDGGSTLKISVALLGKLAVSGSFAFIYMYSAELFPTQVRNIGAGVSTIGARLGGILAPIVLLLAHYSAGLPMLTLGAAGTLAGLLSLTLPETLDQAMPETLQELECQKA